LAAAALAALACGFLAGWRAAIPNREDEEYGRLLATVGLWPNVIARAPRLLPGIVLRMSRWELWQGFWAVAPPALLAGCRGLRRRVALPLLLAFAAPLAVGWIAYSVHASPQELLRVTWNRFLIQGSVPLLLLLALALRDLLRRSGIARAATGMGRAHLRPKDNSLFEKQRLSSSSDDRFPTDEAR